MISRQKKKNPNAETFEEIKGNNSQQEIGPDHRIMNGYKKLNEQKLPIHTSEMREGFEKNI